MCDSTHCDPGDEHHPPRPKLPLFDSGDPKAGEEVSRLFSGRDVKKLQAEDDELRHRAHLAAFVNQTSFAEEVENLRRLAERNYNTDPDPEWPTEEELFQFRSSIGFAADAWGFWRHLV